MFLRKLIIFSFITLLLSACAEISMEEEDKIIVDAFNVMKYLKESDWGALAEHVHEDHGLLFSLYANIDENDIVLTKEQVANIGTSVETYDFGKDYLTIHSYEMTSMELIQNVLMRFEQGPSKGKDIDYQETAFNTSHVTNVTIESNINEVYTEAFYVEFYSPSNDEQLENDWQALRLVFQKERRHWYLVAIVRDVHTD